VAMAALGYGGLISVWLWWSSLLHAR